MVLPRLLAELKHRKVYRAAVVYAAVGWALLEVSDVVLPRLGLPDWTVNLVLAVVLLGFPLAIVFAWIFDISPQGIERTIPLSPQAHPRRFSLVATLEFVLIVALVFLVGGLYVDRLSLQRELANAKFQVNEKPEIVQPINPRPEQYRAIAVLPFVDMSESNDQSWFAEGVAEELLIALSHVKPLSVMARTSSFAFKGSGKTVAEIADILGVQAVLEGSVRRSKDRVRVTAQLVDAHSGFQIWTGSYERQISDIFRLQDELAKSVVEALRLELRVDPYAPLVAEHTRIPEAYNWFIRGRTAFDWANPQGTLRSVSYFEKAVEADPSFAMAWGYLSVARAMMMLFRPFDEVGQPILAAMENALALNPEQSEALSTKAMMTQLLDHDWETAGQLYQRAVDSSSSQLALAGYALLYLNFTDQQHRAIELYAGVEKLDPLHAGYKAGLSSILHWAGDKQQAIQKAREALELDSGHFLATDHLILAFTDTNDTVALETLLENIPLEVRSLSAIKALVARSYAFRGNEVAARKIYEELLANANQLTPIALHNTALLAISLGEINESIELMERIEKGNSFMKFWNKLLPEENMSVRRNPRYQALLKRMGLDDESVAVLNERMTF